MRAHSILNGIANVPISPESNSQNTLTQSASQAVTNTINVFPTPNDSKPLTKVEYAASGLSNEVAYPSLENPYATRSLDPSALTTSSETLDDFLLHLYSSILLSKDKQLLANIISDDKIILGRDDSSGLLG
jgi:hypothetical protein